MQGHDGFQDHNNLGVVGQLLLTLSESDEKKKQMKAFGNSLFEEKAQLECEIIVSRTRLSLIKEQIALMNSKKEQFQRIIENLLTEATKIEEKIKGAFDEEQKSSKQKRSETLKQIEEITNTIKQKTQEIEDIKALIQIQEHCKLLLVEYQTLQRQLQQRRNNTTRNSTEIMPELVSAREDRLDALALGHMTT